MKGALLVSFHVGFQLLEGLLKNTDVKTDLEFSTLVVEHLMPRAKRDYANMILSVYLPTTQYGNEEKERLHARKLDGLLAELRCRFQLFLKATAIFEGNFPSQTT